MKCRVVVLFVGLLVWCCAANAQNLSGIGAMLAIDSSDGFRLPVIKSLLPGSPAAASLKENQFILKVNEVSCKDKTIEEVVGLIRGATGTHVKLSVADNKQGKHAVTHDLVRAAIQQPQSNQPPADPVDAFNARCEQETKKLRRQGYGIVNTFNSDCGNYFFNFNADTGLYHVAVHTLEDKGSNGMNVTVFDSRDEDHGVKMVKTAADQQGTIYFKRAGVGSIKTVVPGAERCRAIYIVVYK